MGVDKMNVQELCETLQSKGVHLRKIANLLGVTTLQVRLYLNGKTKVAGVRVALSISRHISLQGERLIIDPYRGRQDVLDKVKDYETQCSQIVRDTGTGHYELGS